MANPFHPPTETTEAVYNFAEYDEDKDADMQKFMDLLGKAANEPDRCGIHQHDIREIGLGMGLVQRKHCVMYWEGKSNGTRR